MGGVSTFLSIAWPFFFLAACGLSGYVIERLYTRRHPISLPLIE